MALNAGTGVLYVGCGNRAIVVEEDDRVNLDEFIARLDNNYGVFIDAQRCKARQARPPQTTPASSTPRGWSHRHRSSDHHHHVSFIYQVWLQPNHRHVLCLGYNVPEQLLPSGLGVAHPPTSKSQRRRAQKRKRRQVRPSV